MKSSTSETRRAGRPLSFDRDLVLKKAMHAFWRGGYETTSFSNLTEATGLTAPSLYAAFGNKKQLFRETMRLYTGDEKAAAAAILGAPTALDAARGLLHASVAIYTGRDTPRGCLLTAASCAGSAESYDIREEIAGLRRLMRGALKKRINQDVLEGLLPININASTLADMVITLQLGLSILAGDGSRKSELLAVVDQALHSWPSN